MPANSNKQLGFTLIEMVIGIVVFAVALTLFTSTLVPKAIQSIDPIYQVRATELAQSLLNEISGKPFDENSSRNGSMLRCNETGAPACTALLGPESGETRATYDDVDDYHGLSESGGAIKNSLGDPISLNSEDLYAGFTADVGVFYQDIDGGTSGKNKFIIVVITTPNNEQLAFSTFRSNY